MIAPQSRQHRLNALAEKVDRAGGAVWAIEDTVSEQRRVLEEIHGLLAGMDLVLIHGNS